MERQDHVPDGKWAKTYELPKENICSRHFDMIRHYFAHFLGELKRNKGKYIPSETWLEKLEKTTNDVKGREEVIRREIIIQINTAIFVYPEHESSDASGHTIKCAICETEESIPFYELEEDFYHFIKRFIRNHEHEEKTKTIDKKLGEKEESDLKEQFFLLEGLVQKCKNCDNQSIRPKCFFGCSKAEEFILSLKKVAKSRRNISLDINCDECVYWLKANLGNKSDGICRLGSEGKVYSDPEKGVQCPDFKIKGEN